MLCQEGWTLKTGLGKDPYLQFGTKPEYENGLDFCLKYNGKWKAQDAVAACLELNSTFPIANDENETFKYGRDLLVAMYSMKNDISQVIIGYNMTHQPHAPQSETGLSLEFADLTSWNV